MKKTYKHYQTKKEGKGVSIGYALTILWTLWSIPALSEGAQPIFENISPGEAYTLIQAHQEDEDFVILDVRTPAEFQAGHIENAVNIDYYAETFQKDLNELDKTKTYLIYCRSGNRSGKTLRLMKKLNFSTAYNVIGGIAQWLQEELPVATTVEK
jgi:rhodanese-related sulfurtransferase